MSTHLRTLLLTACAAGTAGAQAGDWDQWEVSGSNTARAEYYEISGDELSSPYRFDDGQYFDELNVNFARRYSPYKMFRGQVMALANDSDYRFPEDGLQAERVNLFYENGESGFPMRLEGGDVFSYFSYRTFQRSTKGAQFEFQPRVSGNTRHSLLLFSGANQALWKDWDWEENNSSGASWLMEHGSLGSLNLNVVYNELEPEDFGLPDQDQWVTSLAGETNFNLGDHNINLEAEYAYFDGDHAGDFDPEEGQDQDDNGYFAELMGQAYQQLSYRLRFEEYGLDFRPAGSVVFNDRRSYEFHAGWQFLSGLSLRGRGQFYEDRWDSVNQLDTDIYGLDLTGNLFSLPSGTATGRVRVFREEVEDDFGETDRDSDVIDASVNLPLTDRTSTDLRLAWNSVDDGLASDGEVDTVEGEVGVSHSIQWGDFSGAITPGLSYRDVDGGPLEGTDWTPTLAINLSDTVHTVRASYDYLDQSRDATGAGDVAVQSASLHYHYAFERHELGVDANWYDRDLDEGQNTEASRISVYWTWYFDKPAAGSVQAAAPARLDPAASLDGPMPLDINVLTRLAPGQTTAAVTAKLAESGAPSPARQGDVLIYELSLLQSITNRQRLAIVERSGRVDKVALIIDFADDGTPETAEQSFERVREEVIRSQGAPASTFETGVFGPTYRLGVNTNQLIRNVEWQTGQGVLRLGMPRRVDSAVRIELQHAPAFAPPRNALWSIDEVR